MGYVYLALAIVSEVIATNALKATENFTQPLPSLIVVLGYGAAFYLLARVLEYMSIGVAYAIWSGMGIVLVALVAALWFKEVPDGPALLGMVFILCGVIIINVFSKSTGH